MKKTRDIVITMIGSGGDGVISAGEILLSAAAKEGLYGMLLKSFGPQIRGGESSAKLRISGEKLYTQGDLVDVLLVFNWKDFSRFKTEYEMNDGAYIISDSSDKLNPLEQALPWKEKNLKNIVLPISEITKEKTGATRAKNILSLGILSGLFDLPSDGLKEAIKLKFKKKSKEIIDDNINALNSGIEFVNSLDIKSELKFNFSKGSQKMVIHGNDAMSLAAIKQELDLYASYPITPASEILMFLNIHLPKFNGVVIQAEDEIAAINMAIGASFSGKKAMTGTSGPGVALKSEAIGLASMAEIPLVIVNVMRGGPSTGLPTKFEQADLFQALYGTHGDAPKAVIAPSGVADTFTCGNLAFLIAEKYQMPVILLTDQFLSARVESIDPFNLDQFEVAKRIEAKKTDEEYLRYKITDSGISPISKVGEKDFIYQTSGLEHFENANPTSELDWHQKMSEKRQKKLDTLAREFDEVRINDNDSKIGVITWGSSTGAVIEAVNLLEKDGINYTYIVPKLIYPLPKHNIQKIVDRFDKLLVIELSYGAQFYRYLRSELELPKDTIKYNRAGGKPLNVEEVYEFLKKEYI